MSLVGGRPANDGGGGGSHLDLFASLGLGPFFFIVRSSSFFSLYPSVVSKFLLHCSSNKKAKKKHT